MNSEILVKLREAAIEAGVVDVDLVGIIAPATIAQLEAGQISSTDAIAILRRSKPAFFDARRMGRNYPQLRSETLAAARAAERSTPIFLPAPSKPIAQMDRREYRNHKRTTFASLRGR